MAAQFVVPAVFTAVDKMTAPVRRMDKSFRTFTRSASVSLKKASIGLTQFNNKITTTTGNIKKRVGGMMGQFGKLGLGIGLLAVTTQIVKANVELDASLASLSAITGKSGAEFKAFEKQVNSVAKTQMEFAGDTAKAFEIVASAKPELLANADALARVTNAAITLSKASGDDLAESALSLTGVMNQFNLKASESERVMNSLAAGSVAGSANITNVAASMKNFGSVASSANLSVEESIALVEVMGAKSIFAEEAGTKLRGSLLKLQKAGAGYQSGIFNMGDALEEVKAKFDTLGTAQKKDAFLLKTFGALNISTGKILLSSIDKYKDLTKAVTGTSTAVQQMNTKANTFENRWKEIVNSFKNSIVATDGQSDAMQQLKDIMALVSKNMGKIIGVIVTAIKWFIGLKLAIFAVAVAQKAFIAVLAIAKFAKFIGIVMKIAKAKGIWTAAQWALNAAMTANPIGLIIVGIAALIGVIVLLVKNFDRVKAAALRVWDIIENNPILQLLMFPIYLVIKAIQFLVQNFDAIKNVISSVWAKFMNFNMAIWNMFKAIGKLISVIFSAVFEDIKSFFAPVIAFFQPLLDVFSKIGTVIKTAIIDKFKALGGFVSKIIDTVSGLFNSGTQKINAKTEEILKIQGGAAVTQPTIGGVGNATTRDNKKDKNEQQNSRVDLFLNNRTGGNTEAYTEGTGVNISNTGN